MDRFNEEAFGNKAAQYISGSDFYQIFFEKSNEIYLVTDGSKVVDCNRTALMFWGFSLKNDLIGKSLNELIEETHSEIKITGLLNPAQMPEDEKLQLQVKVSDGKLVTTYVSANVLPLNEQNYWLIAFSPLPEQKEGPEVAKDSPETSYKRIFDSVQDLYFRTDINGIIREVSPSIKKYSNLVDDDLIGKSIIDFYFNPNDRQFLLDEIQKKGEIFDYELLLKGKNGKKIWTSISAHFLIGDDGLVKGMEGWIRDITERKENEQRLKQSLSMLQATMDSTTDGILVVGLNGEIISYNKTFQHMFSLTDELLDKRDDDRVLAEAVKALKNPEQILSKINHLYKHPEEESYDILVLNDGKIYERYSRSQNIDGKPVGRVWSFRDITEKRKAEQHALLMAHTLKSINECVSITDTSDNILFVNEAFSKTYGYFPEELIGKNISVIRPQQNNQEIVNQIRDLTNEKGWKGEIYNQRKDGSVFPISLSTTIIKDEENKTMGLVGVAVDITEQKNAEQNLKENEERYRSLFDHSPDAIFLADVESGTIVGANPASAVLLNKPLDHIIGMHQTELHPKEMNIESKQIFKQHVDIITRREPFKVHESVIERADGTLVPVEIMANIVHINGKRTIQGVFRDISERKAAEKAILESEKRYRLLIENQGEGVTIVDADENFVFANPAAERIFEVRPGTLVGKNLSAFLTPENFSRVRNETQKRSKNKKSTYELEIISGKGNHRILLITATPQTDEAGKFTGTFGVMLDITSRKKTEAEVQAKEALLNTLIQTIPDMIWAKNVEGVYLICNKMFENYIGISKSKVIGKSDFDIFERELADHFRAHDQLAIAKNGPSINEEWITSSSNGQKALFETMKAPMYNSDNEIIGVVGISRDITERKQAEEQLRQSEEKYRKLIERMPDCVYRSTHCGRFVEVNPAMVKMLGYDSIEDLLSIDIKKQLYFSPEDRESLTLQLNDKELDVFPLKKKDGSAIYVEDHGWYVKDSNGEIVYHEGIMRDVTERKMADMQLQQYSKELQELNATKDKFFSIIAHDLKSPFSSIIGLSEILKNDIRQLDITTIEQYVKIINYTSNNTFQLLENLLDWALIQRSHMEFRPETIVVNHIVNDILALTAPKADSKRIRLLNLIPENLVIKADENMVRTIFRNLISNAVKFTPSDGSIQISATKHAAHVEFSVKDSGMGISPENIGKLFNIGTTHVQRGTENEKGTGLGLMLCKEFVERHGGKIWAESEPGAGSDFKFTIPSQR